MAFFGSFEQPNPLDTISIEINNRPYFPVSINGQGPYWLLFDTGGVGSNISQEIAQTLGLQPKEDRTTLEILTIGQTKWKQTLFGIWDTTPVQHLLNRRIDGFLGSSLLLCMLPTGVITINYPAQTLILGHGVASREPLSSENDLPDRLVATVPLQIKNYHALVPVWLDGHGPYQFFLDTGASHCSVSPAIAQALKLPVGDPTSARGVEDALDGYSTTLSRISVGGAEHHEFPIIVMDCGKASSRVDSPVDGYLGHSFLASFTVVFDYRVGQLSLIAGHS